MVLVTAAIRRPPAWLWVPVVVALVVRVGVVVAQVELHLFDVAYDANDSGLYRAIATQLHEHGRFWSNGKPTAYVMPGYPLLLAALFVFGRSTLWIALVQCLLGAITVGLVADTARRLRGPRAAVIAGLAAAVDPHLVFWTGYVLTETLFVLLLVAAVWSTVVLVQRDAVPVPLAGGCGALWAATGMVRPQVLGLALVAIVVALATPRRRRAALVALAGLAVIWAPWVVRNAVTMDAFVPTSTESGYVLYQGNSPGATGGTRGYVDLEDFRLLDDAEQLPEVEKDKRYASVALRWMREHPVEVVTKAPRKLANMFRPVYDGSSGLNLGVTLLTYPLLLGLGGWGLVELWRGPRGGRVVVVVVAYFLLVHAIVTGMIRFRLPVEALLCIAAGVGADALAGRRRTTGS